MKRRSVLKISAGLATLPFLPSPFIRRARAIADLPLNKRLYAISLYGDLKYPPDFTHFDYVNPSAPKGGKIITNYIPSYFNQSWWSFNTLNGFTLKGQAPVGLYYTFDTLATSNPEEHDAIYCLLAEYFEITDDGNTWMFSLRPEAKFHDGAPVTADDVVFSLQTFKEKGHPNLQTYFKEVTSITAEGRTVTIKFSGKQLPSDPFAIANDAVIFPRATFEGRDFSKTTLEPVMASGPYRVGNFEVGKYIEYARVTDYWGQDLPVRKGANNFDIIRFDFFRDDNASFVALTKGAITFRVEFEPKIWQTRYNFPATQDGRIKKLTLSNPPNPGMRGWFFNLRRPKLKDIRTRKALGFAYDFEWSNKNLFRGFYQRMASPLGDPDLLASGLPGSDELALLEPYRDVLPKEAFGEVISPPVSDGSGHDRQLLAKASGLLADVGYVRKGEFLYDPDGKVFDLEFLITTPSLEREAMPFITNLKSLGIKASLRLIDAVQYRLRFSEFDYDILAAAFGYGGYPNPNVMEIFFGSRAASTPGSYNISGIANPVIDGLIKQLKQAKTRNQAALVLRVFDRVIRALYIWVPRFERPDFLIAMWDLFDRPGELPKYANVQDILSSWWYDEEKAKKIGLG